MSNNGHAILRNLCHASRRLAAKSQQCPFTAHFITFRLACVNNNHNWLATSLFLQCRQSRTFSTSPAFFLRQRGPPKKQAAPDLDQSWRKYDPNEGIPLPNGDLGAEQLAEIGGPDLDVDTGNKLLRIIQWRRLSGTLNDGEVSPLPESESDRKIYDNALAYLRTQYPMNEKRAERAWADEEARRLEAEIREFDQAKIVYGPQEGPSKHSKSLLQEMMKNKQEEAKKQRRKMEKKREQEMERLRAEGKHIAVLQPPLALAATFDMPVQVQSPALRQCLERATLTHDVEALNMSAWQRLWPTTLFAGVFISGCIYFAAVYTPPDPTARLWPDTPPAIATCLGLVLLNFGVFLMWRWPPLFRFMNTYFIQVPGYPVALSCLGNVISHQTPYHLFVCISILLLLGPNLHEMVGRGNFLAIWFGTGVFGGWVTLVSNVAISRFLCSYLGASGANAGILAAYCTLNTDPVVGTIFVPDWNIHIWSPILLAALIVFDLYHALRLRPTHIGHSTHLGGYFSGIAAGLALRKNKVIEDKRMADKKKQEMEFLKSTVK